MKFARYEITQQLCRQCGSCARACPRNAVAEGEDRRYRIDQKICDGCGMCQAACKLRAISKRKGLFSS